MINKFMNFKKWFVMQEMPITNFTKIGNWEDPNAPKYGWDKPSIGILNNEKGVQKIKDAWSRSPVDFDLYFVKQPGGTKFLEVGEVSPEYIEQNLKIPYQPNPNAINVFFTQNIGDAKVPMTAWIIAHRLGHSVSRDRLKIGYGKPIPNDSYPYLERRIDFDFKDILEKAFGFQSTAFGRTPNLEKYMKDLMQALGTFRSARMGNIRNTGEFVHELMAQVITTGEVKFNPLPKAIGKKYAWGRPVYSRNSIIHKDQIYLDEMNYKIESMAENYTEIIHVILNDSIGKTYVM